MQEIALHIMDIAENSITAGADRIGVTVCADKIAETLTVTISDNGRGMDEEMLSSVTSPFTTTRTTRRVGLGIPLFKAGADAAGGSFEIRSRPGAGTTVQASYGLSHIDRPPLGDLAGTLAALALANPGIDFIFEAATGKKEFACDTAQIKEMLGGVPLGDPEVSIWLMKYLKEGIDEIFGGLF